MRPISTADNGNNCTVFQLRKSNMTRAERTFRTALYFAGTVTPDSRRHSCEPGRCLSHREGAYYEISIITIKITRAGQRWTTNRRSNNPPRRRQSELASRRPSCALPHARRQLRITAKVDNFCSRGKPLYHARIQFRNLHAEELQWSLSGNRDKSIFLPMALIN